MSRLHSRLIIGGVCALGCAAPRDVLPEISPNEWKFVQTVDVPAAGLIRLNLPPKTVNAAQPDLSDLRLLDPEGKEVPFIIEQPRPAGETILKPKEMRTEMNPSVTRLIVTTGTTRPLESVSIEAPPGQAFVKAVQVEGSRDGEHWETLIQGEPVFRTETGANKLQVKLQSQIWPLLRLTFDDTRTPPVPFTAVLLKCAASDAPTEPMPLSIISRNESPGLTRLAVDLGAGNLIPAIFHIDTPEPLFTRTVTIAAPEVNEQSVTEQPLTRHVIYRIDLNGKPESQLDLPLEKQLSGRDLLLLIQNGDSPPLPVSGIRAERRLQRVIALARAPGQYKLLVGNRQAKRPTYDLVTISDRIEKGAAQELVPRELVTNSGYRGDRLSGLPLTGAPLDVKGWKFRKQIEVASDTVQQLEVDQQVLAHATSDQRDLRIVRNGRQIAFLLERTSIFREAAFPITSAFDPTRPSVSRWSLKLPIAGLPLNQITCTAAPAIFERNVRVFEDVTDNRGDVYPRELGAGRWRSIPTARIPELSIALTSSPSTDTILLETDNGDNPALELQKVKGFWSVTRVIFKITPDGEPVWLYYGNANTNPPRYDVSLAADQFLRADRATVTAGPEEKMEGGTDRIATKLSGAGRYLFWGGLAVVVAVLLWVISRLLPSPRLSEDVNSEQ